MRTWGKIVGFAGGAWANGRGRHREGGLSLVELMVAVAILGSALALAWPNVQRHESSGVYECANVIAREIESARFRAVSTRKWQRLVVQDQFVAHDEATSAGLAAPAAWNELRTVVMPGHVAIASLSPRTHLVSGDAVPPEGTGLGGTMLFSPDGSAQAATIFLKQTDKSEHASVAVFRTTGSTRVYRDW